MSNNKFGFASWDDKVEEKFGNFAPREDEGERIPFMRLKDGSNKLRIITEPARYWQARMKLEGKGGVGERVNTSYPAHDDCPAKAAGLKPTERYYVGVIDRADNAVKILDMSSAIYRSLGDLKDQIEYGRATGFDINIKRNSKAPPANFYAVIPLPPTPLSESDLALKAANEGKLIQSITRLATPPKPEYVAKRMEKLGYNGSNLAAEEPKKGKGGGSSKTAAPALAETSDDDYDFNKAASPN